ncbi:lipocalin-like domain-containing protein [Synechococcus sp. A10-1-5-9]|uniref:lipocalin-like domain-containing protein n=1 Tax=Synechococcus sp. A10-1-5-9 TaxID=3392295 RepID=UPI0039E77983
MNLPPDSIVRLGSGAITRRDALPTPARRCIEAIRSLTYTAHGRMSAVLCKAGRSTRSPSAGAAHVAEQADLFRHSYGYAGRYSLTAAGVVHHVEVAADPNWIGTNQHRITHLENDQLTITTTAIPSVVSPDPVSYEAI